MVVVGIALVVMGSRSRRRWWGAVVGPGDADRALAVDFGFVVAVSAIALLAVRLDAPALLDLVLVGTLVGFLTTVAYARLVGGGER